MPKKDKSFFGKIMGGNVTEENDAPSVPQYIDVEEEDIEVEELIDEEEDGDEEAAQENAQENGRADERPKVISPASSAAETEDQTTNMPSKDEEWMNDYEGALNIDMYQTKDNVIIKSTIAGVRADDIDITVANDMVSIKGSRRREENVSQEDYFYQECYWGNFSRSVIVPVDIDSEHIEADLKDGILTVIVPKAAKAKTKKVKVKG